MANTRFKLVVLQDGYAILTSEEPVHREDWQTIEEGVQRWRRSKGKLLVLSECEVIFAKDVINAVPEEDDA